MAEQKNKSEPSKTTGNKQGNGRSRGAMARPQSRGLSGPYFGPLSRLRSEFDRLFDDFFHGWPALTGGREQGWGLDVQDREDAVVVRADAPGFESGDFDLEIRGDNLVLSASQSEEAEGDGGQRWQKRELYHSVPLPAAVDPEKVEAQYRNGVLTITLPKREPTKGRKIEIKS